MKAYNDLIKHPGNQNLFDAVEMSLLATYCGMPLHMHTEGLRGTGKTTVLRAARGILPPITRVKGCQYNCAPDDPHCPHHRGLSQDELQAIGVERVPMPFVEISHAAKVGTVVGSIDLKALSGQSPTAALLPGALPRAHRGVVFVDEINRLADTAPELADVLLDAMGTKPGRVQIEETGLETVEMPLKVSVWAASNPDEDPGPLGNIRRQLADRFDFLVSMSRPDNRRVVRHILFGCDGGGERPRRPVLRNIAGVAIPEETQELIAGVYIDFGLESLRAVEALTLGAKLHAAVRGRREVGAADVAAVAALALGHRVDPSVLARILKQLAEAARPKLEDRTAGAAPQLTGKEPPPLNPGPRSSQDRGDPDDEVVNVPDIKGMSFGRFMERMRAELKRAFASPHTSSTTLHREDPSRHGKQAETGGDRRCANRSPHGDPTGQREPAPGTSWPRPDWPEAPVLAPPNPARFLAELPDAALVTGEEGLLPCP